MECKKDIIIERNNEGLCPICTALISTDFKVAKYKGKPVRICKQHPMCEEQ
ncbi:unnamed protein product [marine sediment metagenome]|uniref:Uncharacterized protein n=1 Tax=marine sediment metagenome TaxID=412755 RepID=X1BCH2_9ZZZZ